MTHFNNNRTFEEAARSLKASIDSLVGNIDTTVTLDECTDALLDEQLHPLQEQVINRMKELGLEPDNCNLRAAVSRIEFQHALQARRIPSIAALHKIARVLQCNLVFELQSAKSEKLSCVLTPQMNAAEAKAEVDRLLSEIKLEVRTQFCIAVLGVPSQNMDLDYFFSTRLLFRAAASRLHNIQIKLEPTLESIELSANIL